MAREGILDYFEDISPSELFEQLFLSLLGVGFVMAEASVLAADNLSKLFKEYKDYVITTCQGSKVTDRVGDLCQVYETMEMMLLKPEDVRRLAKQQEESNTNASEPRRLNFNFFNRGRSSKDQDVKNDKTKEDNPVRQSFSSKPCSSSWSPAERPLCPDESNWTIV